jgi:cobalt-zinc-cadmium efflux system protein
MSDQHLHGPPFDHDHHDHAGVTTNVGRAFLVAHSMALLADAGHNVGDVVGLALAWGATALARLRPSSRRTFGFRRSTIVASAANALILLFVTGGLTWESIRRLFEPERPRGLTMIVVAIAGAIVNGVSALLFMKDREKDLNLRSAFLHLASDAALAVGVAVAGGVIVLTGWVWIDPIVSIALALTILAGTWSLMTKSLNLMLDAVPERIDPDAVRSFLGALPQVVEVHDLHIWAMSTTETALTAHLVMPGSACKPTFLSDACRQLHDRFGIDHSTLQIDPQEAPNPCALAPDEVV